MTADCEATPGRRTPEQIREHYLLEKKLAARLRAASAEERRNLYSAVYDELYRSLPHHPRLTERLSEEGTRERIRFHMRFLRPYLHRDTVFLEIGPGDCTVCFAAARKVRQVYGVEVSAVAAERPDAPSNFKLVISDGSSIPLPDASVDVAFSNQVMEHVHPDDALVQLHEIARCLKPGGRYLCITPNGLDGPHDISRGFDPEPTGFHLKEYTYGELTALFRSAGFDRVTPYKRLGDSYYPLPLALMTGIEWILTRLPREQRVAIAGSLALRFLLSIRVVARKAR